MGVFPGAPPPPPQVCVNPYVTCTFDGNGWEVRPIPVHRPVDHGFAGGHAGFGILVLLLVFVAFALFLMAVNLVGRLHAAFGKRARKAAGAG